MIALNTLNRVYSASQNDRNDLVLFIKFNSIFVRIFSFLIFSCYKMLVPNAVKNTFESWDFLEKNLPGSEFIFLISGSIISGKLSFEYIHEVFEIINA